MTDSGTADRLYGRLVRAQLDPAASGLAPQARDDVAGNGLRQVAANALQGAGDQVVNAKTVLPWLLAGLGAPGVLVGLLVPIRESGSMLPQAAMTPWVARHRVRKWIWVAGAAGQATSVAAMALFALLTAGTVAGIGIVAALAAFATCRALNSLSGKDVLGRTVPKGQRGQVNGIVTVVCGALAIVLGVGIQVFGGDDVQPSVLAGLLGVAALAWVLALVVYAGVREPVPDVTPEADGAGEDGWVRRTWQVLRDDRDFRRFVVVRTLLLVSALSPPFVVAVAATQGGVGLSGLGPFVIAQGVASLLAGRLFGRLADRSSRRVMIGGSAAASAIVVAYLLLLRLPEVGDWALLHPVTYLLLAFTHIGVRVARKTFVVDLAEGDRRTEYVAVSNTAIGVLLLVTGAVSGALATLGSEVALVFLAALGVVGAVVGRGLPEVQGG